MKAIICNVKASREWDAETNQSGKRIGTTYTVLAMKKRGPTLIDIKIPNLSEKITAEKIKKDYTAGFITWAKFLDYEEDVYARGNQVFYTASASDLEILDDDILID